MYEQLQELASYVNIKRGPTRPQLIGKIAGQRFEALLNKRLHQTTHRVKGTDGTR